VGKFIPNRDYCLSQLGKITVHISRRRCQDLVLFSEGFYVQDYIAELESELLLKPAWI
jgi:hypothetical protein